MELNEVTNLISNVGFPVFVVIWLLVRSDKRTEELTVALRDLKSVIMQCQRGD